MRIVVGVVDRLRDGLWVTRRMVSGYGSLTQGPYPIGSEVQRHIAYTCCSQKWIITQNFMRCVVHLALHFKISLVFSDRSDCFKDCVGETQFRESDILRRDTCVARMHIQKTSARHFISWKKNGKSWIGQLKKYTWLTDWYLILTHQSLELKTLRHYLNEQYYFHQKKTQTP